jgi:hypothetical protein
MAEAQVVVLLLIAVILLVSLYRLWGVRGDMLRLRILDRLEKLDSLEKLDVLETLPALLERIESRIESLRPPPPAEPDEPDEPEVVPEIPQIKVNVELADDIHAAVRDATQEMGQDLKKLLRITGRAQAESAGTRISQRLHDEGYARVRITGGLPRSRSSKARVKVTVDADRDGLAHRGFVILNGDEVEETRLSPLHRMFP